MTHGGRLCNFTIDFYVWMLFLDVGEFKTVVVLLVDEFQIASQKQGSHSEAGEDDERHGVVVWYELGTGSLCGNYCGIVGIRTCKNTTYEHWHKTETEVLYPEDETVGTAKHLLVDNLRNTGPKGCGNEGKGDAEQHDGGVGYDVAVGGRKDEGEDEVTGYEKYGSPHEHSGSLALMVEI